MKHIYILILFPAPYLESREALHKLEKEALKNRKPGQRSCPIFVEKAKKYRTPEYYMGPRNVGYFESYEEAEKYLMESPDYISEGYYTMALIERHQMNIIEGCEWTDELQFYEYSSDDATGEGTFSKIDTPDYMRGTCDFAT